MKNARLFLIDGSSLLYRSYYALLRGGRPGDGRSAGLATTQGLPTGAVYGLLTVLRKILADYTPDYVGIAFDQKAPTVRHAAYAAYKANRKPMPEDLVVQLPYVRRAVEALRIPFLTEERFEADDLLGTLARKATEHGLDVVVVTADKDMYQLLTSHVAMLQVRTETRMIRAEDVVREFGVPPEQVADVLALWGDPTDNIPGVAGIGEKGAKALIAEWKSLDALYASLERLKPAVAAKLRAGADSARLSKELAAIHTGLEVKLDLEALRRSEPDREKLWALASELEFRVLADEFAPVIEAGTTAWRAVTSAADLDELVAAARAAGRFAFHLETRPGASAGRADVVGIGVAVQTGAGAYIPIAHHYLGAPEQLPLARVLAAWKPLLEDPALAKAARSLKAETVLLRHLGIALAGGAQDVSILSYLLNPGRGAHDLDTVAMETLRKKTLPLAALLGKGKDSHALDEVSVERAGAWAAEQAALALELGAALETALEPKGLKPLYRDVELPLVEVLAGMEAAGVKVDVALLAAMARDLDARLGGLTRRIHELAGFEFNIQSPRQLGEVLFDKLQLPVVKKTKKSRDASTDTEVLEELAEAHELPRLVLEHRELAKLKGTYVDALPLLVHADTGRVHTSYNQAVAATGRLSSSDPNLQNIPIRTEVGRQIRRAFVAEPGHVLVVADYSQVELRLVAHLSGDAELVAAFRDGADVHTRTAATMFGIPEALVTPELRRRAKVINFGIVYGMSPFGLSKELGISPGEAGKLIEAYFERYAGVRAWLDRTIEETRASGSVTTLLGRIRYIPEIASPTRTIREYAERTAMNTPIQGTAADLIKVAMVRVARRLARDGGRARLILQVHDELVVEAPAAEAPAVAALVRAEMEGAGSLSLPLTATVGVGPNWLEAK